MNCKKDKKVNIWDVFKVLYKASSIKSTILVLFVFGFAIGEVAMMSVTGYMPSEMISAFAGDDRDLSKFSKICFEYIGLLAVTVLILSLKLFCSDRLAVLFREKLVTQIHEKYLHGNAFYDLLIYDAQIDNPDARITDDITNYGKSFIQALIALSQAPYIIIYYSYMTYMDMGITTVLIFIAFAIVSFIISRLVMNPIVRLTYSFEAANGDFRLAHVNLKENAETVALSNGQSAEHKLLSERLYHVLSVQTKLANRSVPMNVITYICQYLGTALVYLCIYLYRPETDIGAYISRVSYEVIEVMYGITTILLIVVEYSKLCGYSTRIYELITILSEFRELVLATESGEEFTLNDVTIQNPNNETLVEHLTFSIKKGESLFISGPSGSGKSSIFRVLGHVWPVKEGSVITPESTSQSILLLTQRPYLPVITTLDECIAFPSKPEEVNREDIEEAKRLLRIEHLNEREGENWFSGLSPGEQQRVSLARLFVHKPTYALLDEATSAIPQVLEQDVYKRLQELGITCLTIAHNQALRDYHKYSLDLDGEGSYKFYPNI